MLKKFTKIGSFFLSVIKHFFHVDGLMRASALAYTFLLSLVPLTMVAFGIMSAFPAFKSYTHKLNRALFEHFVPSSADVIQSYIANFADQASKLSLIGILFSIITAILLIYTMENTFNIIWQVGGRKHRNGLSTFLVYWALISLLPLGIGAAFAASVYLISLPHLSKLVNAIFAYSPLLFIIPLTFSWGAFVLAYLILPNCRVKFRFAALGALVAAILFELLKGIFSYYITNLSSDFIIYGALAAIPSFLLWIYISWIVIIFGGVIAHLLQTPPGVDD